MLAKLFGLEFVVGLFAATVVIVGVSLGIVVVLLLVVRLLGLVVVVVVGIVVVFTLAVSVVKTGKLMTLPGPWRTQFRSQ